MFPRRESFMGEKRPLTPAYAPLGARMVSRFPEPLAPRLGRLKVIEEIITGRNPPIFRIFRFINYTGPLSAEISRFR